MTAPLLVLLPWLALAIGGVVSAFRTPGEKTRSAVQHFAAGVVFAAAAGEILPSLKHAGALVPVLVGGGAGIVAMLLAKSIGERAKGRSALLALIGIDMAIDGLVLGIAFAAGERQGVLLAIALSIEVLFLGLTVAIAVGGENTSKFKVIGTTWAIGALLPAGALLAIPISTLPPTILTGFFAFGLIALLYLVTEELLREAHETPEPPWVAAMFFVGFLLLLTLEETL